MSKLGFDEFTFRLKPERTAHAMFSILSWWTCWVSSTTRGRTLQQSGFSPCVRLTLFPRVPNFRWSGDGNWRTWLRSLDTLRPVQKRFKPGSWLWSRRLRRPQEISPAAGTAVFRPSSFLRSNGMSSPIRPLERTRILLNAENVEVRWDTTMRVEAGR